MAGLSCHTFQFYLSSIKREGVLVKEWFSIMFQFYLSSIKRNYITKEEEIAI